MDSFPSVDAPRDPSPEPQPEEMFVQEGPTNAKPPARKKRVASEAQKAHLAAQREKAAAGRRKQAAEAKALKAAAQKTTTAVELPDPPSHAPPRASSTVDEGEFARWMQYKSMNDAYEQKQRERKEREEAALAERERAIEDRVRAKLLAEMQVKGNTPPPSPSPRGGHEFGEFANMFL